MKTMKIPKLVMTLFILSLYAFLTLLFPITLALGNQEIANENISFQLFLFTIIFFIGILITFSVWFAFKKWKENNILGDNVAFTNLGEKPAMPFFKRFTYPQITLYGIIFFGWLFFIVNLMKIGTLTGLKFLPTQQFSPTDSLLFSSFLIPGAEEMLALGVIAISVLGLTLLARKLKINPNEYKYLILGLVPFIVGAFSVLWHNTAYVGSDYNLTIVFAFWTVKTFIILITGFFILGFIIHFFNNFFLDFARLFTSDTLIFTVGGSLAILTIITFIIYRNKLLGRKNAQ